jgi:uncharacterized membrane protein YeaQ/YmgE (transglycosylase-associated protein family)
MHVVLWILMALLAGLLAGLIRKRGRACATLLMSTS